MLWEPDVRETDEEISVRGQRLMAWLMRRPESVIALVSHSGFLRCTSRSFGLDAAPIVKDEMHRWCALVSGRRSQDVRRIQFVAR